MDATPATRRRVMRSFTRVDSLSISRFGPSPLVRRRGCARITGAVRTRARGGARLPCARTDPRGHRTARDGGAGCPGGTAHGSGAAWNPPAAAATDLLAAEASHAVSSCAAMPMTMTSHRPWSIEFVGEVGRGVAVAQPLQQLDAQEGADLDSRQDPEARVPRRWWARRLPTNPAASASNSPRTTDGSSNHSHS